jgi:hypothetical protein
LVYFEIVVVFTTRVSHIMTHNRMQKVKNLKTEEMIMRSLLRAITQGALTGEYGSVVERAL